MVKNGSCKCLLTSSGQKWQFHIGTAHLVVKNGNFSHAYSHLVVENGNFKLLLTSSDQEWQFNFATDISGVKNGNFILLQTYSGQELLLTSRG